MTELRMIDGVKDLPIESVEKYLQTKGWTKALSMNPNAILYEGPLDIHGKPILVVLTSRRTLMDTDRRIMDVVRTVAAIESKSPERIVAEIAQGETRRRIATGKRHVKTVARVRAAKSVQAEA